MEFIDQLVYDIEKFEKKHPWLGYWVHSPRGYEVAGSWPGHLHVLATSNRDLAAARQPVR